MHELQQLILDHLPGKKKITNKGWIWFNAPCCDHKGHKADTRQRGNLYFGTDGTVGYHCFNCGHKWRFGGDRLSEAAQEWLTWLGVDTQQTRNLKMLLLQKQLQGTSSMPTTHARAHYTPDVTPMPDQAAPFSHWATQEDPPVQFMQACAYVHDRKLLNWESYEYYWSPHAQHDMCDRVILPFYDAHTIVGWCARLTRPAKPKQPKYWNSHIPSGYLFNQDQLKKPRKHVVVCEGPFDAIACQGVAVMGSQLSEQQIKRILDHDQQPIILPDQEDQNQHMIDQALAFGWAVSFPNWDADIKDAADACVRYGAVYTITSILQGAVQDPIAIQIKRKMR